MVGWWSAEPFLPHGVVKQIYDPDPSALPLAGLPTCSMQTNTAARLEWAREQAIKKAKEWQRKEKQKNKEPPGRRRKERMWRRQASKPRSTRSPRASDDGGPFGFPPLRIFFWMSILPGV